MWEPLHIFGKGKSSLWDYEVVFGGKQIFSQNLRQKHLKEKRNSILEVSQNLAIKEPEKRQIF